MRKVVSLDFYTAITRSPVEDWDTPRQSAVTEQLDWDFSLEVMYENQDQQMIH